MTSKNKFKVEGDIIYISREGWDHLATTTYREDYYNEIITHSWQLDKNNYPTNTSLGGGLHRYIMRKWYGDKTVDDFNDRNFVVDHMNNNHSDCTITNLEFLYKPYNTAKGQQLDKDIPKMRNQIALSIFKDFKTNCYQITIGCNDAICCNFRGKKRFIQDFKLLYDGTDSEMDYPIVLNDAETILLSYAKDRAQGLDFQRTHACDVRVYLAPDLMLTEEEKKQPFVRRGNSTYLVIGNGNSKIVSSHFDSDWMPPEKKGSGVPLHYCEIKNRNEITEQELEDARIIPISH